MHAMTTTGASGLRGGGIAGVLAGLAFALGIILPTLPGGNGGVSRALERCSESGTRWTALPAAAMLVAAALLLAWFLATVVKQVPAVDTALFVTVLTAAATVTLLLVAAAALAAVPVPLMMNAEAAPDAATTAMGELTVAALVAACLAGGVTIVVVSASALRAAVLPRWVQRTGLVVGPLTLLSVVFVPIVLLSVWLVLAGATTAFGRRPAVEVAPAAGVRLTA